MTDYEINGKKYEVEYDLKKRIVKVEVGNQEVEKHRRIVDVLDGVRVANEARRVKARGASLNQYRYDALGRRVIRKQGTRKSALIWWGNSECAEHKHQAGQTVIQNDIMEHPSRLNSVIARAVDGSKFKLEWYHKNYLDHVYAVSDDSGDILEHYRYTAFGEVSIYNANGNQIATTQIDNHILWNTRRKDEVTGYYMYKFRHYSPELGRWPSRDPIQENGGVNLYQFCYNSPFNWFDPLGLQSTSSTSNCVGAPVQQVVPTEFVNPYVQWKNNNNNRFLPNNQRGLPYSTGTQTSSTPYKPAKPGLGTVLVPPKGGSFSPSSNPSTPVHGASAGVVISGAGIIRVVTNFIDVHNKGKAIRDHNNRKAYALYLALHAIEQCKQAKAASACKTCSGCCYFKALMQYPRRREGWEIFDETKHGSPFPVQVEFRYKSGKCPVKKDVSDWNDTIHNEIGGDNYHFNWGNQRVVYAATNI